MAGWPSFLVESKDNSFCCCCLPYPKVAYMEEYHNKKREFLSTAQVPFEDGGYVCITPGLPTPRYVELHNLSKTLVNLRFNNQLNNVAIRISRVIYI